MRLEIGIIALVEEVLGVKAEKRAQFQWLCNKPKKEHFGQHYDRIIELYNHFNGNWEGTTAKLDGLLTPDAYFQNPHHFIFEFDELQHFTTFREDTFSYYPEDITVRYSTGKYIDYCKKFYSKALAKGPDRFRRTTADFNYINGRAAQRAFFDTFRDWLPTLHGLKPTIRIAEFEVYPILNGELTGQSAKEHIKRILFERLEN